MRKLGGKGCDIAKLYTLSTTKACELRVINVHIFDALAGAASVPCQLILAQRPNVGEGCHPEFPTPSCLSGSPFACGSTSLPLHDQLAFEI